MKKSLLILALILSMLMISQASFAEGEINIRIDSVPVTFTSDTGVPFIDNNDRTLVPLRVTMESFGAEVNWNNDTRTAMVKMGETTVEVPLGQNYILKNGTQVAIDTSSVIKDDRTFLPIRAVVEAFGSDVEWDRFAKTVVITKTPMDARKALLDSYTKNLEWKNYDMNMVMNLNMPMPNDDGTMGMMNMLMNMKSTAFMDPMKIKVEADMIMDMGMMKINQPLMQMYMTLKDDKATTYMGMYDQNQKLTWMRSEQEMPSISELMHKEKSKELYENSIKNVKYLGNYSDDLGRTLQKFENTTSFEAYNQIMGEYVNMLSSSGSADDLMAVEMLQNLEDIVFVVYIDEATGEIARYEMDLSDIIKSMMASMAEGFEIPAEELQMLNSMKMTMEMNVFNINEAKDFEIPSDALKAELMEDVMSGLE